MPDDYRFRRSVQSRCRWRDRSSVAHRWAKDRQSPNAYYPASIGHRLSSIRPKNPARGVSAVEDPTALRDQTSRNGLQFRTYYYGARARPRITTRIPLCGGNTPSHAEVPSTASRELRRKDEMAHPTSWSEAISRREPND